jgi:hypothetical protein
VHPVRRHRRPQRWGRAIRVSLALAAVLAGAAALTAFKGHDNLPAAAADPSSLSVAAECQQALGYEARTEQDVAWLQACVHALTPPTVTSGPTASPSSGPSGTPSPSPTSTSPAPSGPCPVAGKNLPGAADPWGGCWPGPGNTGVPKGTVLTTYTGPCTITVANTVIDSKTVTCSTLDIRAAGVVIRKSMLQGTDVTDTGSSSASFTITDSTVVNSAREQCMCIGDHNFTAIRVEVRGGNRSMYCARTCTVTDSWLHAQQLEGAQHGSGLREEQGTIARHNVLVCDYPITNDATTLGCSSDLTGYPDFAPIKNNTISRNLFLASSTVSFCSYGGGTAGKPYSNDPTNATYQVFTENVYQRGGNRKCGAYGPVTSFVTGRAGNVWQGNVWDDGTTVSAG